MWGTDLRSRQGNTGGRRRPRLATVLVFVLLINLGMPAGAVPASGDLPLSWLWSWIPQSGAWAAAFVGSQPEQRAPGRPDDHHVSASETDANGVTRGPAQKKREAKPYKVQGRDGVFDERTSKRLPNGADAKSDLYQNTDGSYSRKVFSDPINYRDSKGVWQPIDRTLTRGPGGRFQQKASDLDVTLAANADDPRLVTLTADRTHVLSYGLAGAAPSAGVTQKNAVTYPGVLPGVDFKIEITASGAKDTLILASPDVPSWFLFPLDMRGLTASLESNGSVVLRDEKGEPRITIPAGFMQDAKFDRETGDFTRSDDVAYELVEWDGGQALRVTPDAAWLRDPARVYPVILDPSSFKTNGDSYAYKTDTSDHSGENNLPVGTYDGGTHVARSYMHFADFATTFNGATISAASLAVFLSWSYNCSATKFDVKMVKSAWSVTTVQWPGPTLGSSIGEASPNPGLACGNDAGNRSVGTWVNVPLQSAAIQTWLTGTANYGLALTARDETASNQWKRFTSRNHDNYSKAPYLLLTYTGPGTPQIDGAYPPSGYVTPTLTPVLIAEGHDPDASGAVKYSFAVTKEDGTLVASSGLQAATSWTVPAGKLVRGNDYTWQVSVTDGTSSSPPKFYALSTQPPQPLVTSRLSQNGGRGFEPGAGNYTTSATDAQLPTVGPALAVTRSYNSQDARTGLAFGTGWSSAFDAKLVELEKDANNIPQSVSITYPSGQEAVFGRNGTSFTAPPGRSGTLKCLDTAGAVIACPTTTGTAISGYRLTEKSGNAYTFAAAVTAGTYGLSEQSDLAQRKLVYHYTAGQLDRVTAASGRSLNVFWSGGHVVKVSTDRLVASDPLSASEWIYSYTGDLLTSVCAPTTAAAPECTGYQYTAGSGTHYPSVVDNLAPTSNWRLTETGGTTAASSVLAQGGVDNGIHTDVTLGQPGPLAGSTATAAGFNGTSSAVTLPISLANESGYRSASVWFKTTQRGKVLLSQSQEALTAGTTNWGYTPLLYVNADGRLSGQFPTAPVTGALGTLVGGGSGLCMGPAGGSIANGALIQLQDCWDSLTLQWTLDSAGRLAITKNGTTKCAEVIGASTANHADLQLAACGTGTHQKWTMMPNGHIMGVASGRCIDVLYGGTTIGSQVQIYNCHSPAVGHQTWFGSAHAPIVSSASTPVVDDGQWHHAVLSASGNSQTLYVDGVAAGTKSGLVVGGQQKYQYIGAGFLGSGWPGQSAGTVYTNKGTASYFNGSIAEVAYFDKPLRQQDIDALRSAKGTAAKLLKKIVTPLGKTAAEITYDNRAGVVSQVIDENGGTWGISPPSVEGSYLVYSSAVLGAGPNDYWRFADDDGVDAVNEVNGGVAGYGTGVTLGEAPGPFGDASWAARFNGTGGHVSIPATDIPTAGPYSISMWFRVPNTTTGGGTLFGYQDQPLGSVPTLWNPALYVGTDGRLRGKLWVSGVNPIATPGRVDDGQWHHVALSASANSQAMYLDGQLVGTAAGTITPNGTAYAYIGAGGSRTWPNARNDDTGYFTGDIAEVAVYKAQQLSTAQVKAQYDARIKAQGRGLIEKYTITDPSDTDPNDVELTTVSFGLPSGVKVAETDALGNETIYGFDGTGMLSTVVDPNGNYTETVRDSRGNISEQIDCADRSASPPVCSTIYYTYKLNSQNPDDPCNDMLVESRDARSSSRADNTYRTSYTYDRKCNLIVSEDALGRQAITAYSGDRNTAAVDGGYIPAGLPIRVVSASGATQRVTYYASGDVATVTDAAGKVTSYEYDALGRAVKRTNKIAGQPDQVVVFTYDKQSRLRTTTEPQVTNQVTGATHRARSTVEYDPDGNTVRQYVEDLSGGDAMRETIIEYDLHNQRSKVIDALGNEVSYTYDTFGNLVTETRPDGVVVQSNYDAAGRMLTTVVKDWIDDPNNPSPATDLVTLAKGYDPAGRVAWIEDAEHWRTRYEYYDNNQVKRVIRTDDAEPPTVSYVMEENFYDGAGNLIRQVTNNGATTTTYRVDVVSRTDQAILDPNGVRRITESRFDADNRPVSNIAKNGTGTVLAQDDVAYDALNRVLAKTAYNGPAGTDLGKVATSRWTLDSASGAATADASGNNPLTASGGVTWSTDHGPTHTAGSAVFDGTGVITGRTTSIDTANSFTIATWVKLDPAVSAPVVVASQDGEQVSGFSLSYNKATGLWMFSMPRGDNKRGGVESAISSAAAATGVWTHLAGVYDSATKKLKIYVNGAKVGETNRTGAPWAAGGKFVVGGGKSGGEGNNRVDLIGRDASGNLLFYPNTGTASSTVFGTAVTLATGFGSMNFFDAGDFDGDGRPDIIARDTAGEVWLYPNTSTGSTVSLGARYSLGTRFSAMNWLGVGDIDGDGRDDLIGRISLGTLWAHRSSGLPGQVKLADTGQYIGSTGFANFNWIDFGDVNNDGREDMLVRNTADGNLYEYAHNDAKSVDPYGGNSETGQGWTSYNVSIGDLTGDGRPDLVARANTDNKMWVYANRGLAAPNMWQARTQIGTSTWGHLNMFVTADMNGDPAGRWRGSIDDVQTYQRALSDADITSLSATSGTPTLPAAGSTVSRTTYAVNNGGLITSSTDALGNVTDLAYDELGRAIRTTSPEVTTETYGNPAVQARAFTEIGYDTFGAAQESRDALGRVSTTHYDALGRTIETIMPAYTPPGSSTPLTPVSTTTYDSVGRVKTVTDPLNRVSSYDYDQLGRMAKVTDPDGNSTVYTYDRLGNKTSTTDPTGARTTATYGFLGPCTSTEHVRQPSVAAYTTQVRYGLGKTDCNTAPAYLDPGQQTNTISPGNVRSTVEYNAVGDVVRAWAPTGNDTRFTFDGLGRPLRTTLYDGSYTEAVYDMAGQVTKVREFSTTGTELATGSTRYNRGGQVVGVTDNLQHETTFAYDATGLLVSQVQPLSATDSILTSFGYDLAGQQTRFTDGRGSQFWTTYNTWGLPESSIEPATTAHPDPSQRTFTNVYDVVGQLKRKLSPGGVSVDFDYDDLGNLLSQTGTAPDASTAAKSFTYDVVGRMRSFSGPNGTTDLTYDDRGLPLTIRGGSGDNDFAWNGDGQLTSRTDAAGTTAFGYDFAGRLDTIANATAGLSLNYDYNALSAVSKITYGGGNYRTYTYDDRHRIDVDELKTAAGVSIAKIDYGFDDNGNETSKTTVGFGTGAANAYTYDWANRLKTWTTGSTTTNYAYDKSGNRTQSGSATFTYDQRNRLLTAGSTSYAYTPRGTMASSTVGTVTTTTVADAFNQIVSQGSGVGQQTYQYDALGRVARPGHKYSGLTNDLASDDPTPGGATGDEGYYVRGPGGGVVGTKVGGSQRYVWTDLHTDVVAQFTSTTTTLGQYAVYDPLGKPIGTPSLVGRLGYQSEWTDTSTGRVNMAARWYNPDTGQFDTRDTVSLSPVGNSGNANRYAYANANPLTATDPTGHAPTASEDAEDRDWNIAISYAYRKSQVTKTPPVYPKRPPKVDPKNPLGLKLKVCATIPSRSKQAALVGCSDEAPPTCPAVPETMQQLTNCTTVVETGETCYINGKAHKKSELPKGSDCMTTAWQYDKLGGKFVGYETGETTDAVTATVAGEAIYNSAVVGAIREEARERAECAASFWCTYGATIVEAVVSTVVGVIVYAGCMAVAGALSVPTAGAAAVVGAVACGAVSGAVAGFVGSLAGTVTSHGWGALGESSTYSKAGWAALTGAAGGAAGGGFAGIGAVARAGAGAMTRVATGAARGVAAGAAEGALTGGATYGVDCLMGKECSLSGFGNAVKSGAATGAISGGVAGGGAGYFAKKGSGNPGAGGMGNPARGGTSNLTKGCKGHSFSPSTRVLLASGAAVAISAINIGDKVVSTNPETGETSAQPVTALHVNLDVHLTDVTVRYERPQRAASDIDQVIEGHGGRSTRGPTEVTLETTQNHPFWDAAGGKWVDAGDLAPGRSMLIGPSGEVGFVVAVRNYLGSSEMRDLTVDAIHTYYVMADDAPILVHNCTTLFRADTRHWTEIFEIGFEARGSNTDIGHHVSGIAGRFTPASAYVATTRSLQHAIDRPGYVYAIREVPGIDVNRAIPDNKFAAEREIAVRDYIDPSDIIGVRMEDGSWLPNPNFVVGAP